ncbi:gap protein [Mycolicibacterium acapulense]|nr:gap protein [Mycolicibacterium acapulense]KUI12798.1 gap protein [Mycolicibacterium acapulense]
MWSSVLVLALFSALNPVRLGLIILVISRPRPVQNLLAFWFGSLTEALPLLLVPLVLLHVTPVFESSARSWTTSSTVRNIQVGAGVLALLIAAVMSLRLLRHRRLQALQPTAGTTSTVTNSPTPTAVSRLLGYGQGAPSKGKPTRWLVHRVQKAWENGSLWVAFVIGLAFSGVEPDIAFFVVAIIVASGIALETQVIAVIVFVLVMLVVVEMTLLSYLVTPDRTQAVLQRMYDWARVRRRQILIATFTVAGVALIIHAMVRG